MRYAALVGFVLALVAGCSDDDFGHERPPQDLAVDIGDAGDDGPDQASDDGAASDGADAAMADASVDAAMAGDSATADGAIADATVSIDLPPID